MTQDRKKRDQNKRHCEYRYHGEDEMGEDGKGLRLSFGGLDALDLWSCVTARKITTELSEVA